MSNLDLTNIEAKTAKERLPLAQPNRELNIRHIKGEEKWRDVFHNWAAVSLVQRTGSVLFNGDGADLDYIVYINWPLSEVVNKLAEEFASLTLCGEYNEVDASDRVAVRILEDNLIITNSEQTYMEFTYSASICRNLVMGTGIAMPKELRVAIHKYIRREPA